MQRRVPGHQIESSKGGLSSHLPARSKRSTPSSEMQRRDHGNHIEHRRNEAKRRINEAFVEESHRVFDQETLADIRAHDDVFKIEDEWDEGLFIKQTFKKKFASKFRTLLTFPERLAIQKDFIQAHDSIIAFLQGDAFTEEQVEGKAAYAKEASFSIHSQAKAFCLEHFAISPSIHHFMLIDHSLVRIKSGVCQFLRKIDVGDWSWVNCDNSKLYFLSSNPWQHFHFQAMVFDLKRDLGLTSLGEYPAESRNPQLGYFEGWLYVINDERNMRLNIDKGFWEDLPPLLERTGMISIVVKKETRKLIGIDYRVDNLTIHELSFDKLCWRITKMRDPNGLSLLHDLPSARLVLCSSTKPNKNLFTFDLEGKHEAREATISEHDWDGVFFDNAESCLVTVQISKCRLRQFKLSLN
mmetsp:Transcript_9362/g.17978  ORF Transcript_9362/g.17978 Transcript_9362/m.17978 type:complete len:411 (+) Transcript_9362:121-1353(+)